MILKIKKLLLLSFATLLLLSGVGCRNDVEEPIVDSYTDDSTLSSVLEGYDTPDEARQDEESPLPSTPEPDDSLCSIELIESYISILTSDEFAGRMPRTPGNDYATAWLAEKLAEYDIEPFGENSYMVGYPGRKNTFYQSEMIVHHNGSKETLVQGIDFFIGLGNGNVEVTVERDSENIVFLGDGSAEEADTRGVLGNTVHFEARGSFFNSTYTPGMGNPSGIVFVQLSDDVYNRLYNGLFDSVEITNMIVVEEKELYHVVGRIRGRNPAIAVVLSAHFDHVGEGGEIIFRGALDNASGTAALLYIAQRLKHMSESQPFDFDIVIAFFNSEEHFCENMRPLGSGYFIPILSDEYNAVFNINLDVIGASDGETYLTGHVSNEELLSAMESFAGHRGITIDSETTVMSDYINFLEAGFPAINFSSSHPTVMDVFHRNTDVPELLSIPQILLLADMIIDFIEEKGSTVFTEDETYIAEMFNRFAPIIDRVRSGEEVRFYDEFYKYFSQERQFYFSYHEALENEARLSYIGSFGDYELRLIRGGSDHPRRSFIYFNSNDMDAFNIIVSTISPESIDVFRQNNQLVEIENMPGFYFYRFYFETIGEVMEDILGFVFVDSENSFMARVAYVTVIPVSVIDRLEPYGCANLTSIVFSIAIPLRSEEEYGELIRSLRIHEFAEGWRMFEG